MRACPFFAFFRPAGSIVPARNDHPCQQGACSVISTQNRATPPAQRQVLCVIHTQGLHALRPFFCLLTSYVGLSMCLEGVPVTQPRCQGDRSHILSLAPTWFRKMETTKKAVMVSLFRVISLSARVHSRLLKQSSDRPSLLSQSCCAPRGFCGLAHARCD